MDKLLAERKFILEASQGRVWSLLGRVIIDSLEMERFHARDDRNFNALTKVKVAFVAITMQVKGVMVDITPPEALTVLLEVKGLRGIMRLGQKVTFKLGALDKDRTELVCKMVSGEMKPAVTAILTPMVKSFGSEVFENIEKRFRQLA